MEGSNNSVVPETLLSDLNKDEAEKYIGGVVFVSIIMVLGLIGNIHVLFIYAFYMKSSNYRIFILVLAMLDFTTCGVGMPLILAELRNPLTFPTTAVCNMRFVYYFLSLSSALLLVVIAIERYRKTCVPLGKQMSKKMAKWMCTVVMVISCLLSCPTPVLSGHETITIPGHNITGSRCYVVDEYKPTKYMAYFNIFLICVISVAAIILTVLYILIWRAMKKRNRKRNQKQEPATTTQPTEAKDQSRTTNEGRDTSSSEHVSCTNALTSACYQTDHGTQCVHVKDQHQTYQVGKKKMDQAKRTTLIFFLITTVYLMSFIPYFVLKILTFYNTDFIPSMNLTGTVLYNTFINCYLINSMANAFIYGFCDRRFRSKVKYVYRKYFSFRQWPPHR